jgi:hypothetical protein
MFCVVIERSNSTSFIFYFIGAHNKYGHFHGCLYICLFRLFLFWRIDPLLGEDLEKNKTRDTAMQRRDKHTSTTTELLFKRCFLFGPYIGVKRKTTGATQLVLGVRELVESQAVKIKPGRVKLKNPLVRIRCQGTADEDTAGWKNINRVLWCVVVWKSMISLFRVVCISGQ